MSDIPQVDINAPLPEFETPVVDSVMVKAKREWNTGIVVFIVFMMMVAGVGWGYQKSQVPNSQISNKSMEIPKEQPVESLKPEADKLKPVYAIFNGSGIPGEAGKLKAKIEALGYEVVEVGNADEPQTRTTVEINNLVQSQKDMIMELVGTGEYLPLRDNTLEYSVKITIGK